MNTSGLMGLTILSAEGAIACDLTVTKLKDGIEVRISDHLGHHAFITIEQDQFLELCQNALENWREE